MRLTTILSLSIFSFLLLSLQSCKQENKAIKQTEVGFTKEAELNIYKFETDSIIKKLDIELAETDYDIQTGLMYRDTMKENQGMLFIFENERERFFYMKNTRIALDLIYLNANKKIVSFQKNAKPFNEASLPSNVPAKFVLEVNAGMVDSWKISVGDSISFSK